MDQMLTNEKKQEIRYMVETMKKKMEENFTKPLSKNGDIHEELHTIRGMLEEMGFRVAIDYMLNPVMLTMKVDIKLFPPID